jgi:predicted pyridoxine 5'-phosphate oxidase superfamily flavin-nucleotide-binding protein
VTAWPWHAGELEAQARAGVRSSGGAIRDQMPMQHRSFFAQLPFVVVASVDPAGRPVATAWTGAPGFVTSPDPQTLHLAVALDPADPASAAFRPGAPFALLGIELPTRRRNRGNGVVTAVTGETITVAIRQSFGNCPQYIHPRELHAVPATATATVPLTHLDADASSAIRRADTFFVATAARLDEPTGGVDISHRGGPAGFIQLDGDTLTIPDYPGNRYFNTLGNLIASPRAALIFADFATGDVLQLQGTTELQWDGPAVAALPGAERLWRLHVDHAWRRPEALGLRAPRG